MVSRDEQGLPSIPVPGIPDKYPNKTQPSYSLQNLKENNDKLKYPLFEDTRDTAEYLREISFYTRGLVVVPVPEAEPPITTEELRQAGVNVTMAQRAMDQRFIGGAPEFIADITTDKQLSVTEFGYLFGAEGKLDNQAIINPGRLAVFRAGIFFDATAALNAALNQVASDRNPAAE